MGIFTYRMVEGANSYNQPLAMTNYLTNLPFFYSAFLLPGTNPIGPVPISYRFGDLSPGLEQPGDGIFVWAL